MDFDLSNRIDDRIAFVLNLMRPPLFAVFVGIMMAGTVSVQGFNLAVIPVGLFYSVLLFFIAFSINDFFDRKIDQKIGLKGGIKGEIVQEEWQKDIIKYGNIFSILLLITSLPFVNNLVRFSVISYVSLGLIYSVPPIRLKAVPILDAVANGIGVFLFFAIGTGLMGGNFSDIIPAAYLGALMFMPIDAMGSCPDKEADESEGIRTSATLLGWKGTSAWFLAAVTFSLLAADWSYLIKLGHLAALGYGLTIFITSSEKVFYKLTMTGLIAGLPLGAVWMAFKIGLI
jgi:4-hydroxybenzoate polyprenyltransferase